MESGEIAGIVGAFAVMAGILTAVILVFLVRKGRPCNQTRPVLSTIWVRKAGGEHQNGSHQHNGGGQQKPSNGGKPTTTNGHDHVQAAVTATTDATNGVVVVNGTSYSHQTKDYNEIRGPDIVPNQR